MTTTEEGIAPIAHLMRRAGFGATYDHLEMYASKGYKATVEELLHPKTQPGLDEALLGRINMGWAIHRAIQQNLTYWVYKMINTKRPLEEKIALFWHSVLCTGFSKIDHGGQMFATIDMFRELGLGNFKDLLVRTSKDPGMIYYLDNCMNHKGAINENWGRELLELFSMGVGNYTEDDVKEASRAFTGWTGAPTFPIFPYGHSLKWDFVYDPTDHDDGEKVFLGNKGRFNGEDMVEIICNQPATAHFVARQMYNFFVADEPPVPQWTTTPPRDPEAINTLVRCYFDSHYDIRSMLRVLFNSDFFKNARSQKVKSPTEIVVGAVKLAKGFTFPSPDLMDVAVECGYMGQDLYNPPSVEGWHSGQEWIDSGTLVERVNFLAGQLGDVTKPGVREIAQRLSARADSLTPEELVDGCLEYLGGLSLPEETRRNLIEAGGRGGPIDTGSEHFAARTAALLSIIVATKEYQLN